MAAILRKAAVSARFDGTNDASLPGRPDPGRPRSTGMGIVIPFPQRPRLDARLVVRLWELAASGLRDSEAYRCLEAEIRRRKALTDAPRQSRGSHGRR
jgi:hypothetical protein